MNWGGAGPKGLGIGDLTEELLGPRLVAPMRNPDDETAAEANSCRAARLPGKAGAVDAYVRVIPAFEKARLSRFQRGGSA